MNTKMINVFVFTAGAAIGSVITWQLVKTQYERIIKRHKEEIESVKEVFSRKEIAKNEPDAHTEEIVEELIAKGFDAHDKNIHEYAKFLAKNEYNKEEGGAEMTKPYVIPPEEFGEKCGYDTVSLTYYADKVLENDQLYRYEEDEIENLIGLESLEHFGEYEEDSVFVRNDNLEIDFEILSDESNYWDNVHIKGHPACEE